jgi:hypothetical protein
LAWPYGLAWEDESTLWIVDLANRRYSVYDTTGVHIRDVTRAALGSLGSWPGRFDAGRLIEAKVSAGSYGLVAFSPGLDAMEPVDAFPYPLTDVNTDAWNPTFTSVEGETIRRRKIPYREGHEWALVGGGHVWVGDTESGILVRKTLSGDTVVEVSVPVGEVLTSGERRSAVSDAQATSRNFDPDDVPFRKPAFRLLIPQPDGGVSLLREGVGDQWTVIALDPDGRFVREALLPVVPDLRVQPVALPGRLWLASVGPYDTPLVHAFGWGPAPAGRGDRR